MGFPDTAGFTDTSSSNIRLILTPSYRTNFGGCLGSTKRCAGRSGSGEDGCRRNLQRRKFSSPLNGFAVRLTPLGQSTRTTGGRISKSAHGFSLPPTQRDAARTKTLLFQVVRLSAEEDASRPVSRVLSAAETAGRPFLWDGIRTPPRATHPDDRPGEGLTVSRRVVPIRSCSRWGLPCRRRCRKRGGLLPRRFTLTPPTLRRPMPAHEATAQGLLLRPDSRTAGGAVYFLWHFP